jgi:hypothetical protein
MLHELITSDHLVLINCLCKCYTSWLPLTILFWIIVLCKCYTSWLLLAIYLVLINCLCKCYTSLLLLAILFILFWLIVYVNVTRVDCIMYPHRYLSQNSSIGLISDCGRYRKVGVQFIQFTNKTTTNSPQEALLLLLLHP